MSTPRDFKAFNARKPVAAVRFASVEEWALVSNAARARGLSLCAFLRDVSIREAVQSGSEQGNTKAHRAVVTKRSA